MSYKEQPPLRGPRVKPTLFVAHVINSVKQTQRDGQRAVKVHGEATSRLKGLYVHSNAITINLCGGFRRRHKSYDLILTATDVAFVLRDGDSEASQRKRVGT